MRDIQRQCQCCPGAFQATASYLGTVPVVGYSKFTLKARRLRLNIEPYNKLDKELDAYKD